MRAFLPVASVPFVEVAELLAGADEVAGALFFLLSFCTKLDIPKVATLNKVFLDIMLYVSYLMILGYRY